MALSDGEYNRRVDNTVRTKCYDEQFIEFRKKFKTLSPGARYNQYLNWR